MSLSVALMEEAAGVAAEAAELVGAAMLDLAITEETTCEAEGVEERETALLVGEAVLAVEVETRVEVVVALEEVVLDLEVVVVAGRK